MSELGTKRRRAGLARLGRVGRTTVDPTLTYPEPCAHCEGAVREVRLGEDTRGRLWVCATCGCSWVGEVGPEPLSRGLRCPAGRGRGNR